MDVILAGVFGGFLVYMGTENWWLTAFAFLTSATLYEILTSQSRR